MAEGVKKEACGLFACPCRSAGGDLRDYIHHAHGLTMAVGDITNLAELGLFSLYLNVVVRTPSQSWGPYIEPDDQVLSAPIEP